MVIKMKNNTGKTKELLQKTIQSLPSDFALSEVRFHLNQALCKINRTETKRHKRDEIQNQSTNYPITSFTGELNSLDAIEAIDKMIQEEKDKLDSFKSSDNKPLFG